ncbi:putative BsuMI modification methylase subunit YdiO [Dyadobacter sp. CECT 9275]|uniref:Cytosine-specific methyltransferase n=1 Tax=Dyadobacter helix TaxID=2822344 RepID=A0A916JHZ6_9BACT|nr:DNA cytosine methyltransferase [Dyadobacter sp. CECT 9275]CAG5012234.1 putative BsuMI modification methylase subunit YdiO [Dyadobacter sp. CECT 9275]
MKAIDLFSGCGGLTLGLKNAGYQVIGAVEIEPVAVKTYLENHPNVKVWAMDIGDVSGNEIRKALDLEIGELDLLAGCPPCQGFSTLTTLNGSRIADEERQQKNDLVFEFMRLVRELQPRAVMLENVPGLFKDKRLTKILAELGELGYHNNREDVVKILNVADFGVPQRRRRMILMTTRIGKVNFAKPTNYKKTVRQTFEEANLPKPGESGDSLHDLIDHRTASMIARIKSVPKDGGSRFDLPIEQQCACHVKDGSHRAMFRDVYGRMKWDDVSPTMTSGCNNPSKGRFIHPEEDRAITLREAGLLQSFPIDYKFSLDRGKTGVALMIGNALPPEFIRVQALQIRSVLESAE